MRKLLVLVMFFFVGETLASAPSSELSMGLERPVSTTPHTDPQQPLTQARVIVDSLMGFDDRFLSDLINRNIYVGDMRALALTCRRANRILNQLWDYLKRNHLNVDHSQTIMEAVKGRRAYERFCYLESQWEFMAYLEQGWMPCINSFPIEVNRDMGICSLCGDDSDPAVLRAKSRLIKSRDAVETEMLKEKKLAIACGETQAILKQVSVFGLNEKDQDSPELVSARRNLDYWAAKKHLMAMWLKAKNLRSNKWYRDAHFYNYQPDLPAARSLYENLIGLGSVSAMAFKRKRVDPLRKRIKRYSNRACYEQDEESYRNLTDILCDLGHKEAFIDKALNLLYGLRGYPCDLYAARELLWDDVAWKKFSPEDRVGISSTFRDKYCSRYQEYICGVRVKAEFYLGLFGSKYRPNLADSESEDQVDQDDKTEEMEPKYITQDQVDYAYWLLMYWLSDKIDCSQTKGLLTYELLKINGRSFALTNEISQRLIALDKCTLQYLIQGLNHKIVEQNDVPEEKYKLDIMREALEWVEQITPPDEELSSVVFYENNTLERNDTTARQPGVSQPFVNLILNSTADGKQSLLEDAYNLLPAITNMALLFDAWLFVGNEIGSAEQRPIKMRFDEIQLTWEETGKYYDIIKNQTRSQFYNDEYLSFKSVAQLFAIMRDYVPMKE